jgi:hypothetical protein
VGHTFFFRLAQVQRKSRVDAAADGDISTVPLQSRQRRQALAGTSRARARGVNIRWLQRVRVKALPLRVVWHKTTTNQCTLSDSQQEELLYLCRCVQELRPSYKPRTYN